MIYKEINQILYKHWDIQNEVIKQIYNSAWQIGDSYILKTGNKIGWLNSNISVIRALAEHNVPVAEIVKTINGSDYVLEDDNYFLLSKRIEGEHITDIYTDNYKELGHTIGEVIGRLHTAFLKCQEEISCYDNNFYNEITGWVMQTFHDKNIIKIPCNMLEECISQLEDIYPKLPRQLIHRDIHLGNMLFQNNLLSGYIDFDLSQINARIFDLCYMSLSLLVGNLRDKSKTLKWFEIVDTIVAGYNSINTLTVDEKKAVPVMMIAIEMLFVAYFANNDDKVHSDEAAEMLIWLNENKDKI
jgi:Putative homoserine kinase type II (protein kinase fold)